MTVIGLTGGTGAGKTTVLQLLKEHGGAALDCDRIYDELLETNEALRRDLCKSFGDAIFSENGALDRKALASHVFSDASALRELNAIVYYYIGVEIRRRLTELKRQGVRLVGIDAVNLIESGLGELCETTVAVLAPDDMRVERITARDGITPDQAKMRISAQRGDDYYRKYAKSVLENDGDEAHLREKAEALLERYWKTED